MHKRQTRVLKANSELSIKKTRSGSEGERDGLVLHHSPRLRSVDPSATAPPFTDTANDLGGGGGGGGRGGGVGLEGRRALVARCIVQSKKASGEWSG